jgi:hypothetical protein
VCPTAPHAVLPCPCLPLPVRACPSLPQDMIPRMSLWTIERLRDEMMICALRCKVCMGDGLHLPPMLRCLSACNQTVTAAGWLPSLLARHAVHADYA